MDGNWELLKKSDAPEDCIDKPFTCDMCSEWYDSIVLFCFTDDMDNNRDIAICKKCLQEGLSMYDLPDKENNDGC